ncbi:MAG: hypothetical protein GX077_08215 [Tissierellia bacterium]|nr:hypothetical protein [Tissierellia bacterium]
MTEIFFLIYLIYGFAFINMGVFSIQDKGAELTNLPLVKSLKYLGYFGIIHGISEWMTMISITGLFKEYEIINFNIKQIFKVVSFAYLMYFGISLLPLKAKKRKFIKKIPLILSILWSIGYILLIYAFGLEYHSNNLKYNTITSRYLLALPSGVVSAIALYKNSKKIEKNKSYLMARRYKALANIFLIYGVLEGLFVCKLDFSPANEIYCQIMSNKFLLPIQVVKASVGIMINSLLIKVIDTFGWEQRERLKRLEEHRITSEARRKLGIELHDGIIQELYGLGLKIEYLMKNNSDKDLLYQIKNDINNTINKTRNFLSTSTLEKIDIEDLNDNIQQMIKKFNETQVIKLSLNSEFSLNHGRLSSEKSTQIYYIIQEAITNIIKHSQGTEGKINIEANEGFLQIEIIDNGIGIGTIDYEDNKHMGLRSMEARAKRIGGLLNIERLNNGTKIQLVVPWEE